MVADNTASPFDSSEWRRRLSLWRAKRTRIVWWATCRCRPRRSGWPPVNVQARRNDGRGNQRTPGSTKRDIPSEMAARLPVDASDLNALATLAPSVAGIDATDSTGTQFSVAGLRPTANSVTLGGLSFGSGSVPQDAMRSTQIVTSTYDVARGEFSGALVASTTRGGTNVPEGSVTYTARSGSGVGRRRFIALGGVRAESVRRGGVGGPHRQGQAVRLRSGAGTVARQRAAVAAQRESGRAATVGRQRRLARPLPEFGEWRRRAPRPARHPQCA